MWIGREVDLLLSCLSSVLESSSHCNLKVQNEMLKMTIQCDAKGRREADLIGDQAGPIRSEIKDNRSH